MPVTIGTNIGALRAQRSLYASSEQLARVSERLSSGQRINRASDDAAGLSVASGLGLGRRVFNQALRNLNDGASALSVADQGIANLTNIVIRQRELAEQAANGIFSATQRAVIDTEAQTLAREYERLTASTSFNGLRLLDGSTAKMHLQGGFGANGVLTAQILNQSTTVTSQALGLGTYNNNDTLFPLNVSGISPATEAEMIAGDFNGDGFDDVLVFDDFNDGGPKATIELYNGSASGLVFQDSSTITLSGGIFSGFAARRVGNTVEFDANGTDGGSVSTFLGQVTVLQYAAVGIPSPENFTFSSGVYDFNGDGVTDRITSSAGSILEELQDTTIQQTVTTTTESLAAQAFSLLDQASARTALDTLESLLQLLSSKRSVIGAAQSRLDVASQVLQVSSENYASAESRIRDADVAAESANLTRLKILQETGAAVLAQANVQPRLALTLLSANGG